MIGSGVTVLGLTGSIAMGKSEAAKAFRRLGVPVFDADAVVHRLIGPGGAAVAQVAKLFPGVERGGGIDRQALGARVFGDSEALRRLEAVLHPLVGVARRRFLQRCGARRVPLAVLDIPLLYEGHGASLCDAVAVVSAPPFVQRARALSRPGMTPAKLEAIQARQMPDREKRRRADFVIPSGLDKRVSLRAIRRLLTMAAAPGAAAPGAAAPRAKASKRSRTGLAKDRGFARNRP
ncbi:MAG: dephospho-CoA kinase [Alphaproteobacteria bacterium]|jgi:dephospho-CoA kinase|nr:dephospho-CoA kinase [Alphaproteobacteria bacterium]MDP6517703.1 dephospho-CoA kinase [Alphaproteobacteria bacterium]